MGDRHLHALDGEFEAVHRLQPEAANPQHSDGQVDKQRAQVPFPLTSITCLISLLTKQ